MGILVKHKDATDTLSGPSPAIWGNLPIEELVAHPDKGIYFHDDFTGGVLLTNNQAESNLNGWRAYTGTTSGSDITDAGIVGGGIKLNSTTDNEGVAIRKLPCFKLALGQGRFALEARVKFNTITDSRQNAFFGLAAGTTLSTSFPITTSDAMADSNFVGFQKVFADGDALDTTYKADGVTAVTVKADAVTLVADTFVKLGMYFDGTKLYFYADGARLADYKTLPSTDGDDFPNDVVLGPVLALMLGHGDDAILTVDWIRGAQMRVA